MTYTNKKKWDKENGIEKKHTIILVLRFLLPYTWKRRNVENVLYFLDKKTIKYITF